MNTRKYFDSIKQFNEMFFATFEHSENEKPPIAAFMTKKERDYWINNQIEKMTPEVREPKSEYGKRIFVNYYSDRDNHKLPYDDWHNERKRIPITAEQAELFVFGEIVSDRPYNTYDMIFNPDLYFTMEWSKYSPCKSP